MRLQKRVLVGSSSANKLEPVKRVIVRNRSHTNIIEEEGDDQASLRKRGGEEERCVEVGSGGAKADPEGATHEGYYSCY